MFMILITSSGADHLREVEQQSLGRPAKRRTKPMLTT